MSQTSFTKEGIKAIEDGLTDLERRRRHASMMKIKKFSGKRAVCPYCLHISTLDKFKTLTKAHIVAQRLECPRCDIKMSTRMAKFYDTVSRAEFSEWFWKEIYFYKGYERMDLDNVVKTVGIKGFTEPFWEAQKRMKALKHGEDE